VNLEQDGNTLFSPSDLLILDKDLAFRNDNGLIDTLITVGIQAGPGQISCYDSEGDCYEDGLMDSDKKYGLTTYKDTIPALRYAIGDTEYDYSIEKQLGDFITRRCKELLDFKEFTDIGIEIETIGDFEAEVFIIPGKVLVSSKYNFKATKLNKVSHLEDKERPIYYDFYSLHRFMKDVINTDLRSLKDIESMMNENYTITRIAEDGLMYDRIIVEDVHNRLDGEKYTFQFLRENRAPDASSVYITDINDDIISSDNQINFADSMKIHCPNAANGDSPIDPDEDDMMDELTYTFFVSDGSSMNIGCGSGTESETLIAVNGRFPDPSVFTAKLEVRIKDSSNFYDSITFTDFIQ